MRCWGARSGSSSNSQTSSALQVEVAKQAEDEQGSRRKHMALPLCGPQQPISAVDLTAWVRGAIGCAWEDRYAAACMQLHSECGCDNTAALQLLERDDLTSVGFKPFHAKQICARLAHRLEAGAVPEASVKQADTEFEDCISDGPSGAALSVPKERGTRRSAPSKRSFTEMCAWCLGCVVVCGAWSWCHFDSFHKAMIVTGYLSTAGTVLCLPLLKLYRWTFGCEVSIGAWGWFHFVSLHDAMILTGYSLVVCILAYVLYLPFDEGRCPLSSLPLAKPLSSLPLPHSSF